MLIVLILQRPIIENIVCNVDITCPRGFDDRERCYVGGVTWNRMSIIPSCTC